MVRAARSDRYRASYRDDSWLSRRAGSRRGPIRTTLPSYLCQSDVLFLQPHQQGIIYII